VPHVGRVDLLVLEPIQLQNLVVGKVERALHAAVLAPLVGLIRPVVSPARLAPDEVRHERLVCWRILGSVMATVLDADAGDGKVGRPRKDKDARRYNRTTRRWG
jgi:hypothetical protein